MIKLPYGYGIDADRNGYTLGKIQINKKTGQEYLSNTVFPSTISDCIKTVLKYKTREIIAENDLELSEAITKIEAMQKEFEQLLNNTIKNKIKGEQQ